MVVVVSHGLRGKDGVTSTIIKSVDKEGSIAKVGSLSTAIVGPIAPLEI